MFDCSNRSLHALRGMTWLLAAIGIASYVYIAIARMAHPYELEWFEGTSVDLVRRILAGQPLYTAPSIDFIPHLYAPLYFYAGAELSKLLGIGFLPLRLLSFASSLGCFVLIFALVRREGGTSATGFLAVGFFAACYRVSGAWYDLARVDSLALLLLLAAVLMVRRGATAGPLVAAGLLGALSLFTKQNALPLLGALSIFAFYSARGVTRVFLPATISVGILLGTLLFDRATGGWFSYYTWKIPGQGSLPHHIRWLLMFWVSDMPRVVLLLVASLAWMKEKLDRREIDDLAFIAPLFGAAVFTSWSARVHAGGYDNALIVVDVWLAIGGALYLQRIGESATGTARAIALGGLAILQFYLLAYDPREQLPSPGDVAVGDRAVEALRQIPGDVLVAHHPYLGVLAGKPGHGHLDLVNTIPRGTTEREILDRQIDDAIHERRYAAIVLDRRKDRYYRRRIRPDLEDFYDYRGSLLDRDALWPVTGLRTRPQDVYLRRESNLPAPTPPG